MACRVHGEEDRHSPVVLEGQLLPLNSLGDRSEMLSGTHGRPRGLDGRGQAEGTRAEHEAAGQCEGWIYALR